MSPVITGGMIIEGTIGQVIAIPGAPVAGTNAIQSFTIGGTPTGGTFTLSFEGRLLGAVTWSAVNATLLANLQAALDAALGTNAVVATAGTLVAGIGAGVLTFSGAPYLRRVVPDFVVVANAMTGTAPTLVMATTTAGVNATYRGAVTGSMLVRTDNGTVYSNTSTTAGAPTWTAQV